jgi:hypothetical protein
VVLFHISITLLDTIPAFRSSHRELPRGDSHAQLRAPAPE